MSRQKQWAKIDVAWYRDDVLEVVIKQQPDTLRLWPILICLAKEQSYDVTNEAGAIKISAEKLATYAALGVATIVLILRELENGEFLSFVSTKERGVMNLEITLAAFLKWQSPVNSARDRMEKMRDRQKQSKQDDLQNDDSFAGINQPMVTSELQVVTREQRTENREAGRGGGMGEPNPATFDDAQTCSKLVLEKLLQHVTVNEAYFTEQLTLKIRSSGVPVDHWQTAATRLCDRYSKGKGLKNPASVIGYLHKAAMGILEEAGNMSATNIDHEANRAAEVDRIIREQKEMMGIK